ncbi:MAG: bifunctional folylpolyglutamate synthase/dihydrofolate synthase [Prochloron sp. SP5CPC1]|nr:bifunctional folylpolyglutamate synthase/dihydrofolate synthase [Candidatus Paraprochloron terpiosi SP5CPC1]
MKDNQFRLTNNQLLQPFQRFGVHLGLERILELLEYLENPHHRVPILHVGGTNGKVSVCAYLSSILTAAGYKVGRYTSPHLVDWNERICINGEPIPSSTLETILAEITAVIPSDRESPTQFEVITAAAYLYFARCEVDLAVMEVGLGGRLDATNVSDRPLVTIITSLSRDHWQRLGSTLRDIAREKAGILKPGCNAVLGLLPPAAKEVVAARIQELNCPAIWVKEPAKLLPKEGRWIVTQRHNYAEYEGIVYPLPLLGDVQRINSAIAIAAIKVLQQLGWEIPEVAIEKGMSQTTWNGRLQWTSWQNHQILLDGAHNPAAAQALRCYIDILDSSVTWVIGILKTKDWEDMLKAFLREGDILYLVPVPNHDSVEPEELARVGNIICPHLGDCQTFPSLLPALEGAMSSNYPIVLCGSLYLVGSFLQLL